MMISPAQLLLSVSVDFIVARRGWEKPKK